MSYTNGLDNPELYFQTVLYTGDGSTQSITLPGDTNMQPDMVWTKIRNNTFNHYLFDAVRGANKYLKPNQTNAEADGSPDHLTAFDSDGFSLGGTAGVNYDTAPFVSWCWKESATAGFDIVDYDGAGAANHSHSLSAVPKFMIVKRYNATESWFVYNGGLGQAKVGYLNDTVAWGSGTNVWGGSDPTSSVFSIGSDSGISGSGDYIAYLWAEKQGFSKFSIFTGNGNADGTFVYTGFRPAFIMIKRTDSTGDWGIFDNKREGYNDETNRLKPNGNDAEEDDNFMDILSNGFKLRLTSSSINASGGTFIYAAFAEAPLVNSNGVPCNAR
jgi:hypothetical protein